MRKPAAKTPTVKPPVQKPPVQKPPVATKPAKPPVVTPSEPKKPPVETKPAEPPVEKPKPVSTKLTAEDVALSRKAIQPKPKFSNTEEFVKIMALNPAQKAYLSNLSITFIGDSIFLNASRNLKSIFPKSYIDAKISRQMYHAEAIMKDLLANNRLKRIVVIHLGTNSPFKMECLNNIMKIAGPDRIVFFVNVRLNRKTWEKDVNNKLATIVKQHGNAHLINWHAFSVHHNNIFYKDQEHPTTNRGNKIFSTFVGHSIIATLNR